MAFSLGQLVDNLRTLKDGRCTPDEFFATYVFGDGPAKSLAESVRKQDYLCMRDEPDDEEDAA